MEDPKLVKIIVRDEVVQSFNLFMVTMEWLAACVESQPLYITKYDLNKIAEMFYFDENTNWNKLLKINTKQKFEKISNYQKV